MDVCRLIQLAYLTNGALCNKGFSLFVHLKINLWNFPVFSPFSSQPEKKKKILLDFFISVFNSEIPFLENQALKFVEKLACKNKLLTCFPFQHSACCLGFWQLNNSPNLQTFAKCFWIHYLFRKKKMDQTTLHILITVSANNGRDTQIHPAWVSACFSLEILYR